MNTLVTTLLIAVIPLVVKIINLWIDRSDISNDIKIQWMKFVLAMQSDNKISISLRDDYERQLKILEQNQKGDASEIGK